MGGRVRDLVEQGTDALKRGDAAAARAAFEAVGDEAQTAVVLEGLAEAAYLALDFSSCLELYERAYSAHREESNGVGAVRTARILAFLNGTVAGNAAAMNGWNARAKTLVGSGEESAERGWVALSSVLFDQDRATRDRGFRAAVENARTFGDTTLEFVALAYLGANLVHADRTEEGMLLLDEACAACAGGEVYDFMSLTDIFCQVFSACEYAHDIVRADEWIRIAEEIAAKRNVPAVSAFCRTHYGGVLTAAGRWTEADEALTEAVRLWALGHGMLRSGALIRLADLRVRQGRLEEAEQLLDGLDAFSEAARPLAAVHLAHGRYALAIDVLDRSLEQIDRESVAAGAVWALLVDVHLAAGSVEGAKDAAERLAKIADKHPAAHYLRAAAALAQGQVCVASGEGDPRTCLREALAGFGRAQLPMELGRARLELAHALAENSPEVAMAEARAALEAFERLAAARLADAAAALVRSLGGQARTGPKGHDVLTKRESQVLELLGHGLSNPEISDRLYISRKTVEHHVGRVLAKLGLRSRAEAAAYAARSSASR